MKSREQLYCGSRLADTAFTVKELLELPELGDARLLAGAKGVGSTITRVNVIEATDHVSLIGPGEFVMTSGNDYREEPLKLIDLIVELVNRGAAALGIQSKRDIEDLPLEVLKEAELRGLPLLELPASMDFTHMVTTILRRVGMQESLQLADLQNRMEGLTRLLLEGRGLYVFLDALEVILGHPIAIVRVSSRPWLSKSLRNEENTELGVVLQGFHDQLFGETNVSGFKLLQGMCRIYIKPIPMQVVKQAFIVLLEYKREILSIDVLSVERLAPLVGLELATVEALSVMEGRYLDPFLQDWLSNKIISPMDWKLRAEVCGYSIPESSQVCAVLVECFLSERRENLKEIIIRIRSERLHSVDGLLATTIGDDLALILPISTLSHEESGEALFNSTLSRLLKELRILLSDSKLKLYVGRTIEGFQGVAGSWAQAKRARYVARQCGLTGEIVTYDQLGVYSLLYMIPVGEEREQFLRRFTIPLQKADRKGGGRLVETLEMFFLCNGNIKLTSERLNAHYNTVVYRLDKIQTLLDISLDDPEDRLQLQLALKLGQISPSVSGA
jgi:purine catabolism regulator